MRRGGVDMPEKKDLNVLIGTNIRQAREAAGYTQERFSEMIGIGPKSLSAIERGTTDAECHSYLTEISLMAIECLQNSLTLYFIQRHACQRR